MSIYKDLLFMHGYVLDPKILADSAPAEAATSESGKPASAPLGRIPAAASSATSSEPARTVGGSDEVPPLAACA